MFLQKIFSLPNLVIALVAGELTSLALNLNRSVGDYFLITSAISVFYFPAGVKLLLVMLGRFPAVVGIFAFSVISGVLTWPDKSLFEIIKLSLIASACYPGATAICQRTFHLRNNLTNLRYHHILFLAVIANVMDIVVRNLICLTQGWPTDRADYLASVLYPTSGDVLGSFVVIGLFNFAARMYRRRQATQFRTSLRK